VHAALDLVRVDQVILIQEDTQLREVELAA